MTNEHTSLEKYTSHTLFERLAKVLCVRDELETELTATYWPQVPLSLAALLSYLCWLLNRGSWGPSPLQEASSHCLELQLKPQLQLTPTNSNSPWHRVISLFVANLLPVSDAFAPNSTLPRLYLDIFDRMHLFLDWRLGRRSICYICSSGKL